MSYGNRQTVNCNICAIPLLFILFTVMIIVVLLSDGIKTHSTELTSCEQFVVCPSSLRGGEISYTFSGDDNVTAYVMKDLPEVSSTYNITWEKENYDLHRGSYEMTSFNLVDGSELRWNIDVPISISVCSFTFYLVKGEDEYNKAKNGHDFTYIKRKLASVQYEDFYTVKDGGAGEYFIILTTDYNSFFQCHVNASYTVKHTRFLIENRVENQLAKSSESCIFHVSNKAFPPACVVVENPCHILLTTKDHVTISYKEAHSGLFYFCLVLAILGGLGLVGAVASCVFCAVHKSKGSQGQTYQSVPSTAAVPAPLPPAYQTPQPVYVQPAPAYGTAY